MHPEIDTEKIQWHKPSHESDYTWSYVERWLDDFGVSFPSANAYSVLDSERTAFRIDSFERGKPVSIVVVATVDHDADGDADGWHNLSRAVRVEVIRC